jgi:general secretion pathway protein C
MKWWLVVALAATTSNAFADQVLCHRVDPTMKVDVQFKPSVPVRDLALWLVGTTCKDVVVADPTILTIAVSIPNGKRTAKQAELDAFAAIKAAGLAVETRDQAIVIKRPGVLGCPSKMKSDGEVPPPIPIAQAPASPDEAALVAGIKVVSPTEREVKEATIEAVLANPMAAVKSARIAEAQKGGKPVGAKLTKAGALLTKLGFVDGDVIESVNGIALTSAEKGLEVYTSLRDAKRLEVKIERGGKPVTLVVKVVK